MWGPGPGEGLKDGRHSASNVVPLALVASYAITQEFSEVIVVVHVTTMQADVARPRPDPWRTGGAATRGGRAQTPRRTPPRGGPPNGRDAGETRAKMTAPGRGRSGLAWDGRDGGAITERPFQD
jgi:hypothetical protein